MEKIIEYFTENIVTIKQTADLFGVDRKRLSEELAMRGIDTNKYSVEKFIRISNAIHNNKYDYSLVKPFKKVKDKVLIICPLHGEFLQDVYSHKRGINCPKCGDIRTKACKTDNTESFIQKAINVHGDTYNYDYVDYQSTLDLVKISCKHHGIFKQMPNKHLQGRGCHTCANEKKGWSKTQWKKYMKEGTPATFYILRCFNNEEDFIKIGRTINTVQKRYASKSELPYKYEIIKEIKTTDSDFIFDLEIKYKRRFKKFRYTPKIPFGGQTECYSIEVKNKIISIDIANQ